MKIRSLIVIGVSSAVLAGCAGGQSAQDAQLDMAIERAAKRADLAGDDVQKIAVYERVYKQNPKSEKAAVEYARILRKTGRIAQAEAILSPFAEDMGAGADAFAEFAAIKVAKGENNEAEIFSGLFWIGQKAVELGLSDGIGHLHETLKKIYGEKTKIKMIEPKKSFIQKKISSQFSSIINSDRLIDQLEEKAYWSRYGL